MFWVAYRQVLGWLTAIGAAVGLMLMLVEPVLLPPDAGEDGIAVRIALASAGSIVGAATGLAAGFGVLALLKPWTWYADRTVASRAWVAALGAGLGTSLLWVGIGVHAYGEFVSWAFWLPLCAVLGLASAISAAVLTTRAARREDQKQLRLQRDGPSEGLL